MNKSLQQYTSGKLPFHSTHASQQLQDHLADFKAIDDLHRSTLQNGNDVLQAIATDDDVTIEPAQVERVLQDSGGKHREWREAWDKHHRRLEKSVYLCQLQQDISQVLEYLMLYRHY